MLAFVLTACGSAASPRTVVGEATTPTIAPLAADVIVWQVVEGPGFTTLEFALSVQPTITVYGDGRLLVQELDESNLGQTPIQLQEGQLSQQEVDDLRRAADESGLFTGAEVDFGSPGISDVGTTTVTAVNAAGDPVSVSAYALGSDNGVTRRQQELRHQLDQLVKASLQAVPETMPMTPTRLAVIGLDESTGGSQAPAVGWPGTSHAALFAGQGDLPCALLPKDETADVYSAALDNPGHHWRDTDGRFSALVKIVVPGTPPCPS
ncbi:MAG: hypothetical protein WBV37_03315 [Nocardioidaceae bacterium]